MRADVPDAYLFDLDGTIYLGGGLLPGARDTVIELREAGATVLFCSNNPTKTPGDYAEKLTALGIPTDERDVYTSLVATVEWITRHRPGATVFPIGEQPLLGALIAAGITVSEDPEAIDLVVASYDRHFDYRKLQIAFDAIWMHKRAELVATNPDRYCPFPGGRGEPDAACVTAAIEAGTGTRCVAVFGKPSVDFFDVIAGARGLDPQRTVMVGDRLATDMAFGRAWGAGTALVLTGEAQPGDAELAPGAERPHVVLSGIDQLVDLHRSGAWSRLERDLTTTEREAAA
ncbi:HAD family hydrolase [Pseudoclavibacter sp. RFBJ3]|uniref:HAD-IIA family hydrolase n=1 Tax=unclassified Pseudoclavibacter TaxID=2615177 RepID=UPI000CE75DA3|nr:MULTISPECIES: HAD-IIA family hydrolase [unclassified Pseudoclavibacter]MBF4552281.1 HAD-IIA family hydrolase [Pseudoclavibacter sp. VKM Ac-2888]PPF74513.1 HAD family hydrolase [Pseudoclavibacter sp. Z016]PPF82544.1 HAD family hydrolase [Pseudoclavibacter sp. RFBJ5]PPF91438.1 HAD family hydrolase [Pseudoclavibacter sp. RFBJ3]PPF96362.1 HAD family hydrolase [Pseudoclavibacter sp. RFBH5]